VPLQFTALVTSRRPALRALRWLAAAVTCYALIGFLIAPAVIKWQLTKILTRELSREVTLEKLAINPFALTVRARGFVIKEPPGREPSDDQRAVSFDELYLNASLASVTRLAPVLDDIRLVRPVVRIVRISDNTYNFSDLIQKFTSASTAQAPTAQPVDHKTGPLGFSLNNIEIVDGLVTFDDRPAGATHAVSEIHVGIPFMSSLPYATDINVEPAFSAKVDGSPIALKGETKPFKDTRETTVRLDLKGLDLARYAGYSPVPLGIRLQRGTLDTTLTLSLTTRASLLDTFHISGHAAINALQLADKNGAPLGGFDSLETTARFSLAQRGDIREMVVSDAGATLRRLRVVDATHRAPLIEIGEVKVGDVSADLVKRRFTIGTVAIDGVDARVVRARDGGFNFSHFVGGPSDTPRQEGAVPLQHGAAPPAPINKPAAEPLPAITIHAVTLAHSRVSVTDYSVKPAMNVTVKNITGRVSDLTPDSAGPVALTAVIGGMGGGTALLDIAGRVNPVGKELFLDLRLSLRNLDLPIFSSYAGAYGGYGIDKGELSLKIKYLIDRRKLAAENNVHIDQLTFGGKVESPTATTLPVRLAAALLKDRHGVIDINFPVSGSLDDPEFRVVGVIIRVFVNLITKAATSPFSLLGAAFGGGEELAFVDFAPGLAAITPEAETRLAALAKALNDHPAVRMDIAGRVDPDADREGLKRLWLERKIKTQKRNAGGVPAASLDEIVIKPEEYERYLTAAYKAETFPKPRNFLGIAKALPVPEMERLMLENAPATDDDLTLLANERAQVVKEWLAQKGDVAPERLFLTPPRIGKKGLKEHEHAARAEFTLK
jgi:hypothetical protein